MKVLKLVRRKSAREFGKLNDLYLFVREKKNPLVIKKKTKKNFSIFCNNEIRLGTFC